MEQMNVSIFKEARDIARNCRDATRRDILRERTDLAQESYDLFKVAPSRQNMSNLVNTWTRMLLAIDAIPPVVDDPTPAGRMADPAVRAA